MRRRIQDEPTRIEEGRERDLIIGPGRAPASRERAGTSQQYTRRESAVARERQHAWHTTGGEQAAEATSRRRFLYLGASTVVAAAAAPGSALGRLPHPALQTPAAPAGPKRGVHAYFNSLADHPRCVGAYSLRDQRQIEAITKNGDSPWVTYDPAGDRYHTPHDAAKVVIVSGKASLRPFPKIPVGVAEGSCLVTWDHLWGREYLEDPEGMKKFNHKQWVLASEDGDERWAEVKARYESGLHPGDAVCRIDLRAYGGLPDGQRMERGTIAPRDGEFFAWPNVWLRYWLLAEDIGTQEPRCSLWCADENEDAACLYEQVTITNPKVSAMVALRCQFNSSQRRPNGPDLVSYMRNAVVLRDVAFDEVPELLARPTPEG